MKVGTKLVSSHLTTWCQAARAKQEESAQRSAERCIGGNAAALRAPSSCRTPAPPPPPRRSTRGSSASRPGGTAPPTAASGTSGGRRGTARCTCGRWRRPSGGPCGQTGGRGPSRAPWPLGWRAGRPRRFLEGRRDGRAERSVRKVQAVAGRFCLRRLGGKKRKKQRE